MDTRKRKRVLKTSNSFAYHHHLSCRSLIVCFPFILFFILLSNDFQVKSGGFQPARIVPNLSVFSSSISHSIQDFTTHHRKVSFWRKNNDGLYSEFKVENRVLFTDHILVIFSANENHPHSSKSPLGGRIDCVYQKEKETVAYPMLSADEYYNGQWIVNCPLPPANYSTVVGLKGSNMEEIDWVVRTDKNHTVQTWDMLAYEAVFDGEDTAVVFAKGLNLRSDRVSDPNKFNCHFNMGSSGIVTKAITAAQEVFRCPVPQQLKTNIRENKGIQVTVGMTSNLQKRSNVIPSIATLYQKNDEGKQKYELCACTMVWNQAGFIKEWITYHAWLGIQRWFIYDNNSDDKVKEVIEELNLENYNVTRHAWPWIKSQEAGFAHCVIRARKECTWVAFFDVDEFYYFPPPKHSINLGYMGSISLRALVQNVSLSLPSVGQIKTDCHNFGPSGLKKSPVRGVILGYTCRLQTPERHKSIVRLDAVDDTLLNQVHHFKLKKGFVGKTFLPSTVVINHYKYQVWDVFKAKFYRRVSTYVVDWQENQNENSKDRTPGLGTEAIEPPNWHLRFCDVWDNRLKDFVRANLADSTTGLLPWERSAQ